MEQLFAPWRIDWVERDDPADDVECIFCALTGREDARDARVVAATDRAYVVLNNYPYNPGHSMVVPRPHGGDYAALDDDTLLEHARLKQRTFDAIEDAMDPDGLNTGLNLGSGAGGSIDDHLHTHVVPRWNGDTNFMAVINQTKVIVEALDRTYDRLHEAFAAQPDATAAAPDTPVRIEL